MMMMIKHLIKGAPSPMHCNDDDDKAGSNRIKGALIEDSGRWPTLTLTVVSINTGHHQNCHHDLDH